MKRSTYFSQRLSNLLFLDIKREKLMNMFNIYLEENVSMPIKSTRLVDKIKRGDALEDIPFSFFIEGMFYVLGVDEEFRFNSSYKQILEAIPNSLNHIKSVIFNEVKNEQFEEAYILIKGLTQMEENKENFDRLFSLAENIRVKDKAFKEEELIVIEKAKEIENYPAPFLYEAIIKREEGNFEDALFCINTYLSKGGKQTSEISDFVHSLKNIVAYEQGKELLYDDADAALKLLIPLVDEFADDAILYYNIAVGYRNLGNHEKAIYYLNEALTIDDALVEVVNELGINYASLGQLDTAIQYLRKAFDATKSIEICTNLIMCYLEAGDITQARSHFEIARKLDSNDEVVLELAKVFKD